MERDNDYRKMITSKQWARLRREVLTAHPLCQQCELDGRVTAATEVHHITPVEDGLGAMERRRLMYSPGNLRALCHACHVAAHVQMGRGGKAGAKRRADNQFKAFQMRYFGE